MLNVTIGRTALAVPVYRDVETTRRIVTDLNERLKAIEDASTRIDTVAFALKAAYELALEAEKERLGRQEDQAAMEHALVRIGRALQEAADRHRPDVSAPAPTHGRLPKTIPFKDTP